MKRPLLLITELIAIVFMLSSCNTICYDRHDVFEIINNSGVDIQIEIKTIAHYNNVFPEKVEIAASGRFTWEYIESYSLQPIYAEYSKGDVIECHFEGGYKIYFLATEYHKFNFANSSNYSKEVLQNNKFQWEFTVTEEMFEYAKSLNEQGLVYAGSEEPGWVLPPQYQEEEDGKGKYKYILQSVTYLDGIEIHRTTYEYDEHDRVINEKNYSYGELFSEEHEYVYSGKTVTYTITYYEDYTGEIESKQNVIIQYLDDDFEKMVEYTLYEDTKETNKIVYQYDELHRLTGTKMYFYGVLNIEETNFSYSDKRLTYNEIIYDGMWGEEKTKTYTIEIEYLDDNFTTPLNTVMYLEGKVFRKNIYEYNPDDLLVGIKNYYEDKISFISYDYNYTEKSLSYKTESYSTFTGEKVRLTETNVYYLY